MPAVTMGAASPAGVGAAAKAFWRWWTGELAALLPARLLDDGSAVAPRLDIVIERDRTLVTRAVGTDGDGAEAEIHDGGLLAAEDARWQALLGAADAAAPRLRLALAAPHVIDTRLRLPAAARPQLGEAIRLRLVQESPLPPAEVCHDWALVGRQSDQLDIALAMARRSDLEALADRCRRLGITDYEIAGRGSDGRLYRFGGQQPAAAPTRLRRERRLALGLLVLVLAGPLLVEAAARWQTGRIAARTTQLRQALAPDLDRAAEQAWARAVMAATRDVATRPPAIAYVEAAAAALPPRTWLQQFELGPDRISIAGVADDPPAAVASLGSAPLLGRMVLDRSGIDPATGQSRFEAGFPVAVAP